MCRCDMCGNSIAEDDWCICETCRNKAKTFDWAYSVGNSCREEVSINGFLLYCLGKDYIEDILRTEFDSFSEEKKQRLIGEYCEEDMLYFIRSIRKQWKEAK